MQELHYDIEEEKSKILPVLKAFASQCKGCGLCVHNCDFHEYSKQEAKKIMTEIKEFLLSDNLEKMVSEETNKFIWECSICEHCNMSCPLTEKIPKTPYFMFLRGILAQKNMIPSNMKGIYAFAGGQKKPFLKSMLPPLAQMAFPDWETSTDPERIKQRDVVNKIREFPKKGADVVFFSGCGYTYMAPDIVHSNYSILGASGEDVVTIGNPDFCCGAVYLGLGLIDMWFEHTYNAVQHFFNLKPRPKIILNHCPGCYFLYNLDLSKYGLTLPFNLLTKNPEPIQLMHMTQYVMKLVKEKKVTMKNQVPMTATFNDVCFIGRKMGHFDKAIYDEPREILKNIPGLNLVDSDYAREDAFCCGAGTMGLSNLGSNPKKSMKNNPATRSHNKLFQNMIEKGSHNLVSPCMACVATFKTAANAWNEESEEKIEVLELTDLVSRAVGLQIPKTSIDINKMMKRFMPSGR